MKKGLLTSLFLLTCLSFSSCGSSTVKVKLVGDEHISFSKSEDRAKVNEDYVVTAIPERGYWLYQENLTVTSNGIPLSDYQKKQYYLDEPTQKITIIKTAIMGDIEITGKSDYKISYLNLNIPSSKYISDVSEAVDKEINITHDTIKGNISPKTGVMPLKDQITVEPSNVNFTYTDNGDGSYYFELNQQEFYQDITINFPS